MRHVPDGVLRRLDDEPLAVPDRVTEHVADCGRCAARRAEIADDAERAARLLSTPQLVPDTDFAWSRLRRELHRPELPGAHRGQPPASAWRRARFPRMSLRGGLAIGTAALVIGGTAAAGTLTTIFAPTHVAPLSVSGRDLQAISTFVGLSGSNTLGGFATPTGSSGFRFGTIRWSSGAPHRTSSRARAAAEAGFAVPLPAHLPAGVGAAPQFAVQPRVSATVTFSSTASSLKGSSVTINAGPAVLTKYGARNGTNVPTLAVATMPRPTAVSTGASLSQIEAFLLRQPGIPPQLAEEVRLLGELRTTLPVPVPQGASVHSVQVAGWPGVLLADSSNAVAGVVWEDGRGMLHVAAGLLDSQDVLNVAGQVG